MVVTEQMEGSGDGSPSKAEGGPLTGIRQEARKATTSVRTAVQGEIAGRMSQVGQQISSGADDLRGVGEKLQEQGREGVANLALEIAAKVEEVGRYFTDADGEQLLDKVRELARRQPWLAAATCFAAGFLAARLVKSSAQEVETETL